MPAGFRHELLLRSQGFSVIIGVDEAGRGPLAGPVVAAAAVLTNTRFTNRIDDSKKLKAPARSAAFFELLQKTIFGIGIVGQEEIDRVNIYRASKQAMERAVIRVLAKLRSDGSPGDAARSCVLVDGNMPLDVPCDCVTLIGGDAKSKTVAAASIFAKVVRDAIMNLYDQEYPHYGFSKHKGYGTPQHRAALGEFGPSPVHRKSFHFK